MVGQMIQWWHTFPSPFEHNPSKGTHYYCGLETVIRHCHWCKSPTEHLHPHKGQHIYDKSPCYGQHRPLKGVSSSSLGSSKPVLQGGFHQASVSSKVL